MMHQHIQAPPEQLWPLLAPGEHHHTRSVKTLCRYALARDTECVRFVCGEDSMVAEFRVDGPDGRLLWHELTGYLTLSEVAILHQMCARLAGQGKLSIT